VSVRALQRKRFGCRIITEEVVQKVFKPRRNFKQYQILGVFCVCKFLFVVQNLLQVHLALFVIEVTGVQHGAEVFI
jgi:hypothetical protein